MAAVISKLSWILREVFIRDLVAGPAFPYEPNSLGTLSTEVGIGATQSLGL